MRKNKNQSVKRVEKSYENLSRFNNISSLYQHAGICSGLVKSSGYYTCFTYWMCKNNIRVYHQYKIMALSV